MSLFLRQLTKVLKVQKYLSEDAHTHTIIYIYIDIYINIYIYTYTPSTIDIKFHVGTNNAYLLEYIYIYSQEYQCVIWSKTSYNL